MGKKPLFIPLLVVHLLIDLAMPSLPGAFRFNPDESVVGILVQPVQSHEFPASQMGSPLTSFTLPDRPVRTSTVSIPNANATILVAFLPRRDPTADRSVKSAEDH
jgi:hypothetical protein